MTSVRATARVRIESVDVVRGVIMVIMALDHTRDFFGIPGQNPTNLASASAALFLTRWVTNFCAPVFFLLTGTGAFLSLRKKSVPELSRFLFTRGLWLLVLETVFVRCLAYQFNFDFRVTALLTLWALGWAMIALGVLVRFPLAVAGAFGAALVLFHNVFDSVRSTNPLWVILHTPGMLFNSGGYSVFDGYPLVPWIGVTALGFYLGQVYDWDSLRRRTILARLGVALTVGFFALRAVNIYGDALRWAPQTDTLFTFLSFLNTNKYPPSLLFLLMTLGPALVLLAAVDKATPRALRPALIIGKVPLFYYAVHFALIHALAVITCLVVNGSTHWMFESPDFGNYPFTPGVHAASGIRSMGVCCDCHVPVVSLVCGRQATSPRRMAQLPVKVCIPHNSRGH